AAQELGPKGVRVNAIVCGPFHTDTFDRSLPTAGAAEAIASRMSLGWIAAPGEVVGTALFLACDASSYMTGALLALDGGGAGASGGHSMRHPDAVIVAVGGVTARSH